MDEPAQDSQSSAPDSTTRRHVVCPVEDLSPGGRRIVTGGGRCAGGAVTGTTLPGPPGCYDYAREGEIIRCPWHGWEFDITTGRSVFNPHKVRVRAYPVAVEPAAPAADDVRVETFPVTTERSLVVLHL